MSIDCIDGPHGCEGSADLRPSLSGTGTPIARCDGHWAERRGLQDELAARYPRTAPSDFDPAYAGESWDETW